MLSTNSLPAITRSSLPPRHTKEIRSISSSFSEWVRLRYLRAEASCWNDALDSDTVTLGKAYIWCSEKLGRLDRRRNSFFAPTPTSSNSFRC
jgi:hypothetical protein